MESDSGWGEAEVGTVDANPDPQDEHDEDGDEAEQGEGVADHGDRSGFRLPEDVSDLRLGIKHPGLLGRLSLGKLDVELSGQPGGGVGDDGVTENDGQRVFS